jgi:hypothetical protein
MKGAGAALPKPDALECVSEHQGDATKEIKKWSKKADGGF